MAKERYLINGDGGQSFQDKFNYGIAGYYNVKRYGAKGDGIQDDTVFIQMAIDDCWNNGGGVVYFPNGEYIIGGSLVTNIGGQNPNCQLYIPPNSFGNPTKHIKFLGESAFDQRSLLITIPTPATGVVLRSTIPNSGDYPALFGGTNDTISFGYYFINALVEFENMIIQVSHGINGVEIGGINGKNFHHCSFKNIHVKPTEPIETSNEPIYDVIGIRGFQTDGGAYSYFDRTFVAGFKYGYVFGELSGGDWIGCWACKDAFTFTRANHTIHFSRVVSSGCKNVIVADEKFLETLGDARVQIDNLTIERGNYNEYWFANLPPTHSSTIVEDPNNRLYGSMTYGIIAGGGFDQSTFNKNGGDNFTCNPMP